MKVRQKGLKDFGIPSEFVPASLGGQFRLDEKVAEWIGARATMEELSSPVIEKQKLCGTASLGLSFFKCKTTWQCI